MRTKLVQKAAVTALLAAACGAASAGAVTYQGVTFTATRTATQLMLEIDAGSPSGNWASATTIGALLVDNLGTLAGVTFTSNVAGLAAWTLNGNNLNNNGCSSGNQPTKNVCIGGSPVALANDMVLTYTFAGNTFNLSSPEVKLNFLDASGSRVGSQFNTVLTADLVTPNDPPPTNNVPEPASLSMLGGGALMAVLARRRARKG